MDNAIVWEKLALLQSPLFAPLQPILARLEEAHFPDLQTFNDLLVGCQPGITVQQGLPLRFVPQAFGKQGFESQYEPRCYLNGEVQTRENNWHDLFNALVWLTFPKTKAAINARHYHALTHPTGGANSQRGAVRDTTTLLDESGVIVACADIELVALLRNFQWKKLFWLEREQVKTRMGFYIVGHGLYEKALQPYIGMTGQGVVLLVEPDFFDWPMPERLVYLDGQLGRNLAQSVYCTHTHDLSPVPLLGMPGWSPDNEAPSFYENSHYFRSGRQKLTQ